MLLQGRCATVNRPWMGGRSPMANDGNEVRPAARGRQAAGDARARIVGHLRGCYCLPFPAGPVIPRQLTKLPSHGVRIDPTPAQRSSKASADIAERWEVGLDGRKRENLGRDPFVQLVRDSVAEWMTRLDMSPFAPDLRAHAGRLPLSALLDCLQVAGGVSEDVVALGDAFKKRLKQAQARSRAAAQKKSQAHANETAYLAYAAPAYVCECGNIESSSPKSPAEVRPLYAASVEEALKQPMGDWLLLLAFFLKQVHAHLAFPAKSGRYENTQAALYAPLRRIVSAIAIRDGPISSVAASLCTLRLQPHWHDNGGETLPGGLPSCFRPELLEPAASSLRDCRAHFSGISRGDPVVDRMVIDVHTLAREAASLLTDSLVAGQLGLTGATHATIAERCQEQNRAGATLWHLPGGPAPAWLLVESRPVYVGEIPFPLLNRARSKRLQRYFAWMTKQNPDAELVVGPPPVIHESKPGVAEGTPSSGG